MKLNLQIRAEQAEGQFENKARTPIVVEFAGVPKAGKTTTLRVYPGFSTPKRKYGKYLSPCCSSEYMTRP